MTSVTALLRWNASCTGRRHGERTGRQPPSADAAKPCRAARR